LVILHNRLICCVPQIPYPKNALLLCANQLHQLEDVTLSRTAVNVQFSSLFRVEGWNYPHIIRRRKKGKKNQREPSEE